MRKFAVIVCLVVLAFGKDAQIKFDLHRQVVSTTLDGGRVLLGLQGGLLANFELKTAAFSPPTQLCRSQEASVLSLHSNANATAALCGRRDGEYEIVLLRGEKIRRFAVDEASFSQLQLDANSGFDPRVKAKTHAANARLLREVFVLDEARVLLVTLGSEIYEFDTALEKVTAAFKFSNYGWQDADFEPQSGVFVLANESGVVFFYDVFEKKLLCQKSLHTDLIYQVAFKNGVFLSGSAQRNAKFSPHFNPKKSCKAEFREFKSDFSVYAVGVSRDGEAAFSTKNGLVWVGKNGVEKVEFSSSPTLFLDFYEGSLVAVTRGGGIFLWEAK